MQLLNDTAKKYTYYLYCLIYGGVLVAAVYFFFQFGGFSYPLTSSSLALGGITFGLEGQHLFYESAPMTGLWLGFLLYILIQVRLAYLSLYKKRMNPLYPLIFLGLYIYGIDLAIRWLAAL